VAWKCSPKERIYLRSPDVSAQTRRALWWKHFRIIGNSKTPCSGGWSWGCPAPTRRRRAPRAAARPPLRGHDRVPRRYSGHRHGSHPGQGMGRAPGAPGAFPAPAPAGTRHNADLCPPAPAPGLPNPLPQTSRPHVSPPERSAGAGAEGWHPLRVPGLSPSDTQLPGTESRRRPRRASPQQQQVPPARGRWIRELSARDSRSGCVAVRGQWKCLWLMNPWRSAVTQPCLSREGCPQTGWKHRAPPGFPGKTSPGPLPPSTSAAAFARARAASSRLPRADKELIISN